MKNEMIRRSKLTPFKMFGEMEQAKNRILDIFQQVPRYRMENVFIPSCEVSEKKDSYLINIDLPGIPRDEINVDISKGKLHVYGERRNDQKEDSSSKGRYGKYERTMTLPDTVSIKDADALFDDGVLTIVLKKTSESKIKRLEIGTKKKVKTKEA